MAAMKMVGVHVGRTFAGRIHADMAAGRLGTCDYAPWRTSAPSRLALSCKRSWQPPKRPWISGARRSTDLQRRPSWYLAHRPVSAVGTLFDPAGYFPGGRSPCSRGRATTRRGLGCRHLPKRCRSRLQQVAAGIGSLRLVAAGRVYRLAAAGGAKRKPAPPAVNGVL